MRVFKIIAKVALYMLLLCITLVSSGESFVFTYQPAGEQAEFLQDIRGQYSYRSTKEELEKEPAYKSSRPLRYLFTLGDDPSDNIYAAVMDQSKGEEYAYDRLYFDSNNNEDLTDDQPVDGVKAEQIERTWLFKGMKLKLKIADTEVPYELNAQLTDYGKFKRFVLRPACYYKGELKLDSKSYEAIVVDFNSNGIFNDKFEVAMPSREDRVSVFRGVAIGDKIFIDWDGDGKFSSGELSDEAVFISKYLRKGNKFYQLALNYLPAGEEKGSRLRVDISPVEVTTGKLELGKYLKRLEVASAEKGYFSFANEGLVEIPVGAYRIANIALMAQDEKKKKWIAETGQLYSRELQTVNIKPDRKTKLQGGYPLRVKMDLRIKSAQKSFTDLFNLPVSSQFSLISRVVGMGDEQYRIFHTGEGELPTPTFEMLDERDKVVMSGKLHYG